MGLNSSYEFVSQYYIGLKRARFWLLSSFLSLGSNFTLGCVGVGKTSAVSDKLARIRSGQVLQNCICLFNVEMLSAG